MIPPHAAGRIDDEAEIDPAQRIRFVGARRTGRDHTSKEGNHGNHLKKIASRKSRERSGQAGLGPVSRGVNGHCSFQEQVCKLSASGREARLLFRVSQWILFVSSMV